MTAGPTPELRFQLMRLEHLAVTTVALLAAAGVDTLLLKGPVTSQWLYGGLEARSYRDVDVLIRPAHAPAARRALVAAGFTDLHAQMLAIHRPTHERTWTKEGQLLDVHTRLAGVPAACGALAFDLLWAAREPFLLQGATVSVLSPAARTVHLALHAAQSDDDSRARRDLDLGIAQLPLSLWREAIELSERLRCAAATASGLRTAAGGVRLADELGVSALPTIDVVLRATSASMEAQNLWEAVSSRPRRVVPKELLALLVMHPKKTVPLRTSISARGRSVIALAEIARAARTTRRSRTRPTRQGLPVSSIPKGSQPGNPDISEES